MHLFMGLFTYTSPQAGMGRYNLTELCLHVRVCICVCRGKVDNYPDFTRLHFLSSLYGRQSPSDRTGKTTFVCAGMCAHVSMRF